MPQKQRIQILLDDVHLKLLEELQPYFGNSTSEVVRNIVLRWLEGNIGSPNFEKLRQKGVIK